MLFYAHKVSKLQPESNLDKCHFFVSRHCIKNPLYLTQQIVYYILKDSNMMKNWRRHPETDRLLCKKKPTLGYILLPASRVILDNYPILLLWGAVLDVYSITVWDLSSSKDVEMSIPCWFVWFDSDSDCRRHHCTAVLINFRLDKWNVIFVEIIDIVVEKLYFFVNIVKSSEKLYCGEKVTNIRSESL